MPNGYGYGNQRGRGGYRSNYQYQQPTAAQQESFFNPIPLEFLQENLQQHQGRFDAAYAGALAAKDELAQQQVGMADIASKNQIINQGMQDIDKLVEDQYGGNWAKAAKGVARNITAIRQNPFWNAQKEAQKMRESYGERAIALGSKGMQFGADPRTMSIIDPETGKVRSQESFMGRIVEQGDWAGTARELMAGLTADDQEFFNLEEGELQGFIRGEKVSEITLKKIREIAQDEDVQAAFLRAHPEFREGFEQLDPDQKRKFGLEGDSLTDLVEDQLFGVARSAKYRKQTASLKDDWRQKLAAQKAKQTPRIWGADLTNTAEPQEGINRRKRDRMFNRFQGKNITRTTEAGVALDWEDTGNLMTDDEFDQHIKQQETTIERTAAAGGISPGARTRITRDKEEFGDLKNLVENLRKNNPELVKGLNDNDVLNTYYNDQAKFALTFDRLNPIINDDVTEGLGRSLMRHVQSGVEFVIEGERGDAINVTGKDGISESFNIGPQGVREYLRDEEVDYGYNYDNGMYYVEMPVFKSKQNVYNPKAEVTEFKKLYFAPDDNSKLMSAGVQDVENSLIRGEEIQTKLPAGDGQYMVLSFEGNEKILGRDIQEGKHITVTFYDEFDEPVINPDTGKPKSGRTSLNSIKARAKDFQTFNLTSNYVTTEME